MLKNTKIIYGILFLLLLVEPHIIRGHIAGMSEPLVQSLVIFIIIGAAALVYRLHYRDIKMHEEAKKLLEEENSIALHHLTDLSAELGLVNRRLPLLHHITTDLLKKIDSNHANKQAIISELLTIMVMSLSQTEWGIFRFIDSNWRTVDEFKFARTTDALPPFVLDNKMLARQTLYCIFTTTHKAAPVQCHFIIPKNNQLMKNNQYVVQNVVDQAQLLYQYLYR